MLWNECFSESCAHAILAANYVFDYEVEELSTKITTAVVIDIIKLL